MKTKFDAVPYNDLKDGFRKIKVFRSDYSRPLCKHLIDKHEVLRKHLFFNQFTYYVYRRSRHYKNIRGDDMYELLDVPFDPSEYFDGLYIYIFSEWIKHDGFSAFVRNYLFPSEPTVFLLSTCMECGVVGYSHAERFKNRHDYLLFQRDGSVREIGGYVISSVPKIKTIDGLIKEMLKKRKLDYRVLNFLGKEKVYEFTLLHQFRKLDRMWILKRNGDLENVS